MILTLVVLTVAVALVCLVGGVFISASGAGAPVAQPVAGAAKAPGRTPPGSA